MEITHHGTPGAEVIVDESVVRSLLLLQHPDLAELSISLLDSGWDNLMFRLGTEYIVRLPRRAAGAQLIINEQSWLPTLAHGLSLPIPSPARIGVATSFYPWNWSIVPWFDGEPADLAPCRESQAAPMAAFLRSLHTLAPANAPENPVRGVPLVLRREAVEARMAALRAQSALITDAIDAVWRKGLDAVPAKERRWIHGDLHAGNVLVKDGVLCAIIDWGDITAGDVATDVACIWTLLDEAGARATALRAYEADRHLIDRARAWALVIATALLVTGLVDSPRLASMGRSIVRRLEEDCSYCGRKRSARGNSTSKAVPVSHRSVFRQPFRALTR